MLKLELLLVSLKDLGFLKIIFPIIKLIVRVLHRRLPKAHICHHRMALKSKLDMLDCSTLGCRVCLFGQSPLLLLLNPQYQLEGGCHWFCWYALFSTSLYALWQTIAIMFCYLCSWCSKGELLWIMNYKKCQSRYIILAFNFSSLKSL